MTHALFPISVNSDHFSSENTLSALATDVLYFDKITFLVADRLQVYNDIAKANGDLDSILSLDWSGGYRRDFQQRKRWLSKLRDRLPVRSNQIWRVIGVSDIADRHTYAALRSIWLLYRFDASFAADVDGAALDFSERQDVKKTDLLLDMSLGYILEEVAINVRLRVMRRIFDEYYLGDTLPLLPRLYDGCYLKSAEELLGRPTRPAGSYRFWSWHEGRWSDGRELSSPSRLRLVSNV